MTNLIETIHFDGFTLPVSDIERSIAFYQQFGFKVEMQHPNFALLRLGEGSVGLLKVDLSQWPRGPRGGFHVELSVESGKLDALLEELEAQGTHLSHPPRERPWERQMFTYDPDGYRLEIAEGHR